MSLSLSHWYSGSGVVLDCIVSIPDLCTLTYFYNHSFFDQVGLGLDVAIFPYYQLKHVFWKGLCVTKRLNRMSLVLGTHTNVLVEKKKTVTDSYLGGLLSSYAMRQWCFIGARLLIENPFVEYD